MIDLLTQAENNNSERNGIDLFVLYLLLLIFKI